MWFQNWPLKVLKWPKNLNLIFHLILSIEDENCSFLREIDAKLETLKNYLAQQNGKRSRNLSFNQTFSKYGNAKDYISDTLFEIFIFCPKIQLWFPEKIVHFWGVKNSWKCCAFGLFSCWQLWFHEKNCQKKIGWKTRENVGVLSKLNFRTKIWLFE